MDGYLPDERKEQVGDGVESEAAGRRLYTLCTTENNGETFNARVVDEAGNLFVELKNYLTVSRPG